MINVPEKDHSDAQYPSNWPRMSLHGWSDLGLTMRAGQGHGIRTKIYHRSVNITLFVWLCEFKSRTDALVVYQGEECDRLGQSNHYYRGLVSMFPACSHASLELQYYSQVSTLLLQYWLLHSQWKSSFCGKTNNKFVKRLKFAIYILLCHFLLNWLIGFHWINIPALKHIAKIHKNLTQIQ